MRLFTTGIVINDVQQSSARCYPDSHKKLEDALDMAITPSCSNRGGVTSHSDELARNIGFLLVILLKILSSQLLRHIVRRGLCQQPQECRALSVSAYTLWGPADVAECFVKHNFGCKSSLPLHRNDVPSLRTRQGSDPIPVVELFLGYTLSQQILTNS